MIKVPLDEDTKYKPELHYWKNYYEAYYDQVIEHYSFPTEPSIKLRMNFMPDEIAAYLPILDVIVIDPMLLRRGRGHLKKKYGTFVELGVLAHELQHRQQCTDKRLIVVSENPTVVEYEGKMWCGDLISHLHDGSYEELPWEMDANNKASSVLAKLGLQN